MISLSINIFNPQDTSCKGYSNQFLAQDRLWNLSVFEQSRPIFDHFWLVLMKRMLQIWFILHQIAKFWEFQRSLILTLIEHWRHLAVDGDACIPAAVFTAMSPHVSAA